VVEDRPLEVVVEVVVNFLPSLVEVRIFEEEDY
jgi:hypothetical protein